MEGENIGRDDWNWGHMGIEVKTHCIGNAMKPTRVTLSKTPSKGDLEPKLAIFSNKARPQVEKLGTNPSTKPSIHRFLPARKAGIGA